MFSNRNTGSNKTFAVPQAPLDTVSCIAWFPVSQNQQTLLAASSWDKTVRVWDVRNELPNTCHIQPKVSFSHDAPVLSCAFSKHNVLFSGGCDSLVKLHHVAVGQSQVIGKHDAPVSAVAFDEDKNVCVTGSWDGTLKFWDCRQPTAAYTCNLKTRVYSMDLRSPVLIVAGCDSKIHALSMDNPQAPPMSQETPLKLQLRTLRLMPTKQGFAVASIEGRCSVMHFSEADRPKNINFKCHRLEERGVARTFPVNSLAFHPSKPSILATAGSDGRISFWETLKRMSLGEFENFGAPVTQVSFDATGDLVACAASYDWHKGCNGYNASKYPNKLVIRPFPALANVGKGST